VASFIFNVTFHGIGQPPRKLEPEEQAVWMSQPDFEAILDAVLDRDDVRITFDDGNASDVEIAIPALLKRDQTATFFVVAGRLEKPGFLREADVSEIAAAGMSVGSHGMNHVPWTRLDRAGLHTELVVARQLLERLTGRPVAEAACPFGAYDRRALGQLRKYGYTRVYTSDGGAARVSAWLQPRNTVLRADGPESIERIAGNRPALPTAAAIAAKRFLKRWR
jgi:peptidoglycan/xylan/chitin deacetylase (PgdA/CDA1 family)